MSNLELHIQKINEGLKGCLVSTFFLKSLVLDK